MRIQNVSITAGATWLARALRIFRQQPMAWISLCAAWALVSIGLLAIPLIGSALMVILQPGFFAGFVLACRDQQNGETIGTRHLFAGLKASGRLLIVLGSITLLLELMVLTVFEYLGMFDGLRAVNTSGLSQTQIIREFSAALGDQGGLVFAMAMVVVLIKALLWFSAALIAYRPMPVLPAIILSVLALLANPLPMLVFAFLLFGVFTLAIIPWALGLLVFFPLYAITHYVSFADVFDDSDEIAAPETKQ